jgi:hypothetical protein
MPRLSPRKMDRFNILSETGEDDNGPDEESNGPDEETIQESDEETEQEPEEN